MNLAKSSEKAIGGDQTAGAPYAKSDSDFRKVVKTYGDVLKEEELEIFFNARMNLIDTFYYSAFFSLTAFIIMIGLIHGSITSYEYPALGGFAYLSFTVVFVLSMYMMYFRGHEKDWADLFRSRYRRTTWNQFLDAKQELLNYKSDASVGKPEWANIGGENALKKSEFGSLLARGEAVGDGELKNMLRQKLQGVTEFVLWFFAGYWVLVIVWQNIKYWFSGATAYGLAIFSALVFFGLLESQLAKIDSGFMDFVKSFTRSDPWRHQLFIFELYLESKRKIKTV